MAALASSSWSVHRSTGPLTEQLLAVTDQWARSQHRIVVLAGQLADSPEWVLAGSPTAAHWLAAVADVEACTAREWVRIGHKLRDLPVIAESFAHGRLSYAKVRTLTRVATPDNEAELERLALTVAASDLGRALAAWLNRNTDPDRHHQRQRSVTWRNEPDGMVTFTLRLPPLVAGALIAWLTMWAMTRRRPATHGGVHASADAQPAVAQQRADAIAALVTRRTTTTAMADGSETTDVPIDAEIVIHVRGDGATLGDGTPLPNSVVERIAPASFIRALIHDAERHPINASGRQRHPSVRQRRVVNERDRICRDCGRADLLEYDHVPAYQQSGRTLVEDLELRCAPCHHRRHAN